jgi:hypothetical protein
MPGFTAEASIFRTNEHYSATSRGSVFPSAQCLPASVTKPAASVTTRQRAVIGARSSTAV